jgi:hypothetical protein
VPASLLVVDMLSNRKDELSIIPDSVYKTVLLQSGDYVVKRDRYGLNRLFCNYAELSLKNQFVRPSVNISSLLTTFHLILNILNQNNKWRLFYS